ncbi:Uncharacterised protein [Actinomyces bovis]|uniref:Integrase catalytic domain-containing protein n=1 Tax=Actinomyces bovis TaxID=1658 RepID=A0ABY1VPZ1_9ACTO|nr:Uncharacterised protein [Actinomyces bovis]VEG56557.1 Uncharacterised protein [Actinomyces israelii]
MGDLWGLCGKYLAVSMSSWLGAMEAEGSPTDASTARTRRSVLPPDRAACYETSSLSAAPEMRSRIGQSSSRSLSLPTAEPSLQGEFVRTVNFTDVLTGWVFTRSIRNNAQIPMLGCFEEFIQAIPYTVSGID